MTKFIERIYPYFIALSVTILWWLYGYDLSISRGFDSALESTSTMCSILLGFIVAILPVVLSLRTKGSYVDKVLENGGGLLKSYCVQTFVCGFILIIINTFSYFRFDTRHQIRVILFYTWIFFVTVFVLCCIRCIYFLIRLILPKEDIESIPEESEAEKKYKQDYK